MSDGKFKFLFLRPKWLELRVMIKKKSKFLYPCTCIASDGWPWTKPIQLYKQNETKKDEIRNKRTKNNIFLFLLAEDV